jgi:hypothetical protein
MSKDQVKRYDLNDFAKFDGELYYASMELCKNGDWVSYLDYKTQADRIEELEAKLKISTSTVYSNQS